LLQVGKAGVQLGAIRLCPRNLLREDVVRIDAEFSKRVDLKREVLVVSADARMTYQASLRTGATIRAAIDENQ
jgi:hypothetical protein